MSKASQAMQNLARQLFTFEARHAKDSEQEIKPVVKVCERLRGPLTTFAGPVGYSSLLSRALALAQTEVPELERISLQIVGGHLRLVGPNPNPKGESHESREQIEVEIVAQLLGLLAIFIGESLMITLLRDAWPSESFDTVDLRSEVKS